MGCGEAGCLLVIRYVGVRKAFRGIWAVILYWYIVGSGKLAIYWMYSLMECADIAPRGVANFLTRYVLGSGKLVNYWVYTISE